MGKTQAISIRPGLSLYKQPLCTGRGSPNWYARVYMAIGPRTLHVKSTGTTDIKVARQFAENYWGECAVHRKMGTSFEGVSNYRDKNDGSFDHVAERWLAAKKAAAANDPRKRRASKDDEYIYFAENGLARFFGHDDVNSITTDRIRDYLQFQIDNSRKGVLATTTQKRTLVSLQCILKSAFERRLLHVLPLMPRLKLSDNPRPYFTRAEYRRLYVTAWVLARRARAGGDRGKYLHWMEMADFVIFMVSTFLRPSEWKEIRFKDITVKDGGATPHLKIVGILGKSRLRDGLSMPEAIPAYRRMIARSGDDRDAFIFKAQFSNRQTAIEKMRDSFEALLKASGLKSTDGGKDRVSYCLRHSAIMFRLLEGDNVSLLLLAKAAGTSVDQIERFYGSHLKVEMELANLQSSRR